MNEVLQKILQDSVTLDSMSRVAEYAIVDGLTQGAQPLDIVARLPLRDRFHLYDHLVKETQTEIRNMEAEDYHALVSAVGKTIDLREEGAVDAAVQAVVRKPQLRAYREPSQQEQGFDGFQSALERNRQDYLAWHTTLFMPEAVDISPGEFIRTRMSEFEQGTVFAFLNMPRKETSKPVQAATSLFAETVQLTPAVWSGFRSACLDLEKNQQNFQDKTINLIDAITAREIEALGADGVAALSDKRAYNYLKAMNWVGTALPPALLKSRTLLYMNLPIARRFSELRETQVDTAISYWESLTEDQMGILQSAKANWGSIASTDKRTLLHDYISSLAEILQMPQVPNLVVASKNEVPEIHRNSNGYFLGWVNGKDENKNEWQWANTVTLIDDIDNRGAPLSTRLSLRASLSVTSHEGLHSADSQMLNLWGFGPKNKQEKYLAALTGEAKPEAIDASNPFFYSVGILYYTVSGLNSRASYISSDQGHSLYRQQPCEKNAWSFQNQFAAALNGHLVSYQIEKGERVLQDDLRQMFKKVGQVLAAREALTGDTQDLVPLKNYDRDTSPFGALTARDGDVMEGGFAAESDSSYVTADFSKFAGKADVLTYLHSALDKLSSDSSQTTVDYLPLYKQSADFLIQVPHELWAIRAKLPEEDAALAAKLDQLAIKSQELGEDLSDYSFVVSRKQAIQERMQREVTQKAQRKRVAASLAAEL